MVRLLHPRLCAQSSEPRQFVSCTTRTGRPLVSLQPLLQTLPQAHNSLMRPPAPPPPNAPRTGPPHPNSPPPPGPEDTSQAALPHSGGVSYSMCTYSLTYSLAPPPPAPPPQHTGPRHPHSSPHGS